MLISIAKALVVVVASLFIAPVVGLLNGIAVFCTSVVGFWVGVANAVVDLLEPQVEADENKSIWDKHVERLRQEEKIANESRPNNTDR